MPGSVIKVDSVCNGACEREEMKGRECLLFLPGGLCGLCGRGLKKRNKKKRPREVHIDGEMRYLDLRTYLWILSVLHEQLFHEVYINFGPSRIIARKHIGTPPSEEGKMVQQDGGPFILIRDLDEVTAITEEVAGEGDRLTVGQTMYGKDGEIGIEGDEERVEVLVDLAGRRDGAE